MNAATTPATAPAIPQSITPTTRYEGVQARVLEMLGNGLAPETCAAAMGISPSYISDLVATEEFSRQVAERRFLSLQAATTRDRRYDNLEDELTAKLENLLPMMFKPMEIIKALTMINGLKRRGAGTPENTTINQTIVQLTLPAAITSNYITNHANQVIEAGGQELITIQAANLSNKLAAQLSSQLGKLPNATIPTLGAS
jgi:hypothetical protein